MRIRPGPKTNHDDELQVEDLGHDRKAPTYVEGTKRVLCNKHFRVRMRPNFVQDCSFILVSDEDPAEPAIHPAV